ncbi:MAG: RNA polymerase sigma factor, partial [Acidimicrobiia bacterium]|nr:RNA polymerase sigma factor [Acidimicrobiia bacterium]
AGMAAVDGLAAELGAYHPYHTARSYFLTELGRNDEAAVALSEAIGMIPEGPERRLLADRLASLRS